MQTVQERECGSLENLTDRDHSATPVLEKQPFATNITSAD
jgi:hypothetical protein